MSQAILDDIRRLGEIVRTVVYDPTSGPIHVPEVGGSEEHISALTEEVVRVAPSVLAAVTLHHAAGDSFAARTAVTEALTVLHEIAPNAFSGSAPAKALFRLCLRRTLTDRESADSSADYASISEARRGARQIADNRGWLLSEMEPEALELDRRIRQDAIDKEANERAASEARIRAKSRVSSDPTPRRRTIFG